MHFLPETLRPHGREQVHDLEKDGMSSSAAPYPPPPPLAHRATILEPQAMEQLNTFRHMVGIHSTKGFIPVSQLLHPQQKNGVFDISHTNLHFDGRAAPNVGIVSHQPNHLYFPTQKINVFLTPSSTTASATANPKPSAATNSPHSS